MKPSPLKIERYSDKFIDYFLFSYFLGGMVLAIFYDTWLIAFGVGGLCLAAYYITKWVLPDSGLYQYVLSGILGIFMAQFIYQMHGLFEMHFFAFIGSAILITYQNWKLQIPIMLIVLVHHAIFGYLQNAGFEKVYFTQLDYFNLQTLVIHIFLAAVIFFISGLWAHQLKKSNYIKAVQSLEMERLQQENLVAVNMQKEQLERHVAVLDKAVAQGKFEMASDVMHDIGNAVVGFSSHLTRVQRLHEVNSLETLQNLAVFFEARKSDLVSCIGAEKADAVVTVLNGMADTQRNSQVEIDKSIAEQVNIVANIQEILHIQRHYIEGHAAQERKLIDLAKIVNDALAIHFAAIDRVGIDILLDIAAELPLIKGDRTKLMQVLLSVLKNSMEAIEIQGGNKTISLHAHVRDGLLTLEIRDTGNGFDEEVGNRIFKRGFTTKPSGAGLALYNCRAIVESHAGTIAVKSDGNGLGARTSVIFKM